MITPAAPVVIDESVVTSKLPNTEKFATTVVEKKNTIVKKEDVDNKCTKKNCRFCKNGSCRFNPNNAPKTKT